MLHNLRINYTAPGAYSKHAPGAVCISNMVLEHIWLKKFFQIIKGPGPLCIQDHYVLMVQDHMVPDHKLRPKSPKSVHHVINYERVSQ